MSVGGEDAIQIFDEAYKGNLSYIKEKLEEDKTLVNKQDSVSFKSFNIIIFTLYFKFSFCVFIAAKHIFCYIIFIHISVIMFFETII